jgi:hypothetical protein
VCESLKKSREKALAGYEGQGGQKKDFNQHGRDMISWFTAVPGLDNEMQLLAWKHRHDDPFVHASRFDTAVDGSGVRVEMIPRSLWDAPSSTYGAEFREDLRRMLSKSSFFPEKSFVCAYTIKQGGAPDLSMHSAAQFTNVAIRGTAIVEPLTAATRPEDLADAFAWVRNAYASDQANIVLRQIRDRSILLHGSTTLQGSSVPVPTRAINNEVAYTIMKALCLEFDIRLQGLRGAAHLNGRRGVIRGWDFANHERLRARLDDGTCVSVKACNFVHVAHGGYKRISP